MPARQFIPMPLGRNWLALVAVFTFVSGSYAQPKPADPPKSAAVKLPDGTVIFYTKSPDDPSPPIDGVVLSAAEYKTLIEQADQARKAKDTPKPVAPSGCAIRGRIETRGERAVGVLSVKYTFRTILPRVSVALGCQRGFPVAAKFADGTLPVLIAADDGLSVLVPAVGEYTLDVEIEVPVGPRGTKGDPGFDLGLPRAAVTTLRFDPPNGLKRITVGVRTAADRPGDLRLATEDTAAVASTGLGLPLGPIESLQVTWDPPAGGPTGPTEGIATADIDTVIRVDDTQIETTAKIRLKGSPREWHLILPMLADVAAERADPMAPKGPAGDPTFAPTGPSLTRPTDLAKPVWTFRPPDQLGSDWILTAVSRQLRPKPTEAKYRGPYPMGPVAVPTANRVTGTVRVFAPPTVRLGFKKLVEDLRRQDSPAGDDDPVAVFKYATVVPAGSKSPAPAAFFDLDARPSLGFLRVQPTYAFARTEAGWKLRAEVKCTPVRTDAEQILVDVPTGWQGVEAGPPDLVEDVQVVKESGPVRQLAVRLAAAQKAPFDLTLSATFAIAPSARDASLPFLHFPGAVEQSVKVSATVPEGLELRGVVIPSDDGSANLELKPPGPTTGAAVTAVTRQFDRSLARVDLAWNLYRPDLAMDVRADVTFSDRQAVVVQSLRFKPTDGESRPIRLRGPDAATGLRANPPIEPVGPGEWLFRPAPDAKEYGLTVTYAIPLPKKAEANRVSIGFLGTDAATRTESTVRVWGSGSARRVVGFEGPWRELPPEPATDRDTLPGLTLVGSGPIVALVVADASASGPLPIVVERAVLQAWVLDGVAVRSRYLLKRWSPTGVDVELPPGIAAEVTVEGRKIDPAFDGGIYRIPLPEQKAGRTTLLLEVRTLMATTGMTDGVTIVPPRLLGASYRTPVRWQIVPPSESVLLMPGRSLQPETRWTWRQGLVVPTGTATANELDSWLTGASESEAVDAGTPGDAITGRQSPPLPIVVYPVPRLGWMVLGSCCAFAVGLGLTRLRPGLVGPGLGLLGLGAALGAVAWPQVFVQAIPAFQPGILAVALVLGGVALARWYARRRSDRLPGFTRVVAPADGLLAIPSGSRLPAPASTGTLAPVAPSGSGNLP